MWQYPSELTITPRPLGGKKFQVEVPGSKSITNRAFILGALQQLAAPGRDCTLTGALQSEDTEVMIGALRALGLLIEENWPTVRISGQFQPSAATRDLFVANSGTSMRFLAALCAILPGAFRLDGIPRMRERPIEDLLNALRDLGIAATSDLGTGCPPITITSQGRLTKYHTSINSGKSSQFLSALLLVAAWHGGPELAIDVPGTRVSEPYIIMTESMLRTWGIEFSKSATATGIRYLFPGTALGAYQPQTTYAIEPDASAASYFWGAAALGRCTVTVRGLSQGSLQGDVRLVEVLAQMGARVEYCSEGVTVHGANRTLRGVDVDMNDISDTVMTVAAVACFAEGPTTIRNVKHIRYKETDRIEAVANELRKLGAAVEVFDDGLRIVPGPLHGARLETYNDHRMAMSLALIGLNVPGVVITNPGCVAKTYPGFWADFEKLR